MGPVAICTISVNQHFHSQFTTTLHDLNDHQGMWISERQQALNFRHRQSEPGYASDWHVAGDPTLIVLLRGELEIELRSGEKRIFKAGEQFIAADYLPLGATFANDHGHRARVVGEQPLQAVHIKLAKAPE